MKKHEKDKVILQTINFSIYKILKYISSTEFEDFFENTLIQDAVFYRLGIIGKASHKLSARFKNDNAHVPWDDIMAMCTRLDRDLWDYGIDFEAVWETLKRDIPGLKREIEELLNIMYSDNVPDIYPNQ
ncbi:DUF86 domain-containing protein [bacterium]|nr:DUF86 domain-containing protein [candidate division CSSED10-310 bacterium]